jgi:pimeloyl-ACP methyl ester carboxylesterase
LDAATARAPSALLLLSEGRSLIEFGASLALLPWLRSSPMGDGHSVLVLPGLAASDLSTEPLRRFLVDRGYDARAWAQGRNLGLRDGLIERLRERLRSLHAESGRTVSLVGWSLGGIFARELAKLEPELVRLVISLGSPFAGNPRASHAWRFYEFAAGHKVDAPPIHTDLAAPPPVPTTSIYSRSDGVVAWECCRNTAGREVENIEVDGSHTGLGHHPAVLHAIADRLAQPEGAWRPFDRHSGRRALLFRDPDRSH